MAVGGRGAGLTAAAPVSRLIGTYLDHLSVERGLSANTVAGYRRDLFRYADYLTASGIEEPEAIDPATITGYTASLYDGVSEEVSAAGAHTWRHPPLAASSAARALAAVRGLHKFAVEEGIAGDDPAALIKPPQAARRLPAALGIAEVGALWPRRASTTRPRCGTGRCWSCSTAPDAGSRKRSGWMWTRFPHCWTTSKRSAGCA